MKISCEDYELVNSGTVVQIKNYPIKVNIKEDLEIELDFMIVFNFINNSKEEELITKVKAIDNKTLSIEFVNFDGRVNVGNTELLEIAYINDLKIYLNYRISDLKNVGKSLTFNFFKRKEAKDGE